MEPAVPNFFQVETPNPHLLRMREILTAHPEVKGLFGPTRMTALYTLGIVALQLALAYFLRNQAWWWILLASYLVGAMANHALFVIIHECTHNLAFKGSTGNRLLGIFANLPLFLPNAMPFAKYHMLHHTNQAEYDYDADLAGAVEARWVGNSAWRKTTILFFFSLVQGIFRPMRLKQVSFWDGWILLNFSVQFLFLGIFFWVVGWKALLYLALSTFFAIGLHPMGGRWIQEHYLLQGGTQETYSYYGPLNKLCFNMGYHNEHHDFMKVPWNRLPKLKKMAPEYYDHLIYYNSWVWVLWKFITDPKVSLLNRVVRRGRSVPENSNFKNDSSLDVIPAKAGIQSFSS